MKRTTRRLSLDVKTIRTLTTTELSAVAGGAINGASYYNCQTWNCAPPPMSYACKTA